LTATSLTATWLITTRPRAFCCYGDAWYAKGF